MFDPTQLSPEQRRTIIQSLKRTRNNPMAMLKLHTLQQALALKRWVENNVKANREDFATVWNGFENQINTLFEKAEQELLNKVAFHESEISGNHTSDRDVRAVYDTTNESV